LTIPLTSVRRSVGSRIGAVFRRSGLACYSRFLMECLNSLTVNPVPTPATSNPACGFPALGFPIGFLPKFMGPILLVGLSAPVDAPGMH
jgi:hypothetical protein